MPETKPNIYQRLASALHVDYPNAAAVLLDEPSLLKWTSFCRGCEDLIALGYLTPDGEQRSDRGHYVRLALLRMISTGLV